jgi:hypothetical protein
VPLSDDTIYKDYSHRSRNQLTHFEGWESTSNRSSSTSTTTSTTTSSRCGGLMNSHLMLLKLHSH